MGAAGTCVIRGTADSVTAAPTGQSTISAHVQMAGAFQTFLMRDGYNFGMFPKPKVIFCIRVSEANAGERRKLWHILDLIHGGTKKL